MKSPILGSSYVARSTNAADNRMINLFPEIVPEGGKEPAFLNRAPGLNLVTTVGTGPIRGMLESGQWLYVVSGSKLYKVNQSYVATLIGNVRNNFGPVSMAFNGTQLFVADNGPSFVYNLLDNTYVENSSFPQAQTVTFIDGYFIFNEPDSQRFWVTESYDGTVLEGTSVANAEGSPDGIVSLIADHNELWLFGGNSVEVWYDAGLPPPGVPFQRIQGAFNEIGCAATYSVAKLDNSLFWLGADARGKGIVYRANGYTGVRVSTHAVEYAIAQYDTISDAIAYTYQQEGHTFYVLTFPSANATWVYDASTQAWHERASWDEGDFIRHRSNCRAVFNGEVLVGDFENSNIYSFDLDVYSDNGGVQKWIRSWRALPTGQNNLRRTAQHSMQLDCEVGFTLPPTAIDGDLKYLVTESGNRLITESGQYITNQATITGNPQPVVLLRWSDDGGHTWSNYHGKSMGTTGQTGKRVIWRRLGMTLKLRDRVYEVSGTDPVKIAIMGAELIVTPTNA
jgi:hypothetical protein